MIRQAILVKFLGATNHLPSRVKASAGKGRATYTMPRDLDRDPAAPAATVERIAAERLRDFLGWKGELIQGSLGNDLDVFVFAS